MRWLIFLCLSIQITEVSSQATIQQTLVHPVFDHTSTGLSVRDMSSGMEVVSFDSDRLLAPASSLKLITTFVGILSLEESYTFRTILGYTGVLESDGTLSGDLVVMGGGDPTLGSGRINGSVETKALLDDMLRQCRKAGITCIDGNIVVNTQNYGEQAVPDQWNYNDIGNYYASGSWGFNINENLYDVTFAGNQKVGSVAKIKDIEPYTEQLHLTSLVTIAGPSTGDQAYIYGIPRQPQKVIRGTIPATKGSFKIKGALPNPPLVFAELVHKKLVKSGIQIHGDYTESTKTIDIHPIHSYESPNLFSIVKAANHNSVNLYCEAILKELGKQKGENGTINEGINIIHKYLKEEELPTDELVMKDGSGLAGENKVTASFMTAFLSMVQNEIGGKILTLIPQVGKEGTVKNLLKGSPVADRFYLKSGSFEGVQSYSGYLKAKSGKSYSICLMVNNYTVPYRKLKQQLEQVLMAVYSNG